MMNLATPSICRKLVAWLLAGWLSSAAAWAAPVDATLFFTSAELADSYLGSAGRELTVMSAPIQAPFPFTVAIPSWNAVAPAGTGLRFAIRIRLTEDITANSIAALPTDWSPWLTLGEWGDAPPPLPDETLETPDLRINVDTLETAKPVKVFQWRYTLFRSAVATASPLLRRLAICLSGDDTVAEGASWKVRQLATVNNWTGVLPVPFRSQETSEPRMKGSLCSPTTTFMALAYHGAAPPSLEDFARRIYDKRFDLFGVWPRAVAAAAERGLPAYVTRFRNWNQVRAELAKGHLLGASIRFKEGELERPPAYRTTKGHLLLIRGFLPSGEIVVNDPAQPQGGEGFVWLPRDLEKAWLANGGVAYVFEAPAAK
ncbi:MAG: C39 family peptidase [Cyanobacteria bacterium NC_groundwater_1444_Ag_S-0.65um_54_12]|nr:C39 family peptidase [Cyanobacteria bacterium NC_groundwater_1444_Ag_S-0.65um_54_12]